MNLTRVIFGADYCPIKITKDFTEVKRFFRGLKEEHSMDDDELSWNEISVIYLFIYDDRYSVDRDMSWELLIVNEENDELVEQKNWYDRMPWFYCQPLDLVEFLSLNKEYNEERKKRN